jgi:hypothetical protein
VEISSHEEKITRANFDAIVDRNAVCHRRCDEILQVVEQEWIEDADAK